MACASSCLDQNHDSYGECLRAKNIKAQWLGGTGSSYGDEKAWDRENVRFEAATKDGVNPASVGHKAIDAAYRAADARG